MSNFKCTICLKNFNRKSNYIRHLNRKYKCKKINVKNSCIFCNIKYKRKSDLNKHLKNCKIKKEQDMKEELLSLLIKEIKQNEEAKQPQIEQQNLYLKHKIDLLQGQLKIKNKTINSHNNINSNNNQTINILAYNKTDMSHITDKDFERIMRGCNMWIKIKLNFNFIFLFIYFYKNK